MLPSGWTLKQHSLNISINKAFKEYLRNRYISHCIENNNVKVSKSAILEWVDEIRNYDWLIKNEMIFNS